MTLNQVPDFPGDQTIRRTTNVTAACMQCGRLLIVTTVPVPLVRGATYQAGDIPEDQLDKLRCSECGRANRADSQL